MTEPNISLRAVCDADNEFLFELYCTTRSGEVSQFGWPPEQADAFLRMQFTARRNAYKMQFPSAVHQVIVISETPAGSVIVDRSGANILLTDIAVLPHFQGKGIATYFVRKLQDESASSKQPLVLHVDKTNTYAFDFYKKLGFAVVCETQIMWEMRWSAS